MKTIITEINDNFITVETDNNKYAVGSTFIRINEHTMIKIDELSKLIEIIKKFQSDKQLKSFLLTADC